MNMERFINNRVLWRQDEDHSLRTGVVHKACGDRVNINGDWYDANKVRIDRVLGQDDNWDYERVVR